MSMRPIWKSAPIRTGDARHCTHLSYLSPDDDRPVGCIRPVYMDNLCYLHWTEIQDALDERHRIQQAREDNDPALT